jgi:tRNA pseudouridine55 synthase
MARKPKTILNGWINLNKPEGMTSNDALMIVKRALGFPKIGHAGTLDPLASGILPIALGEATKLVQYMMDDTKIYTFTVTWGEERTTDDREGTAIKTSDARPTRESIENILPQFRGEIMQTPPIFSAIKVDGERAYDLARAGAEVELKARPIDIYDLTITEHTGDTTTFRAVTGRGAYVRSLARDFGRELGCFGYISCLIRDAVGPLSLKSAIPLDFFQKTSDNTDLLSALLPVETVLDDIPVLALDDTEARHVKNGQMLTFVARPNIERLIKAGIDVNANDGGALALASYKGKALAILEVDGVQIHPVRVFNL